MKFAVIFQEIHIRCSSAVRNGHRCDVKVLSVVEIAVAKPATAKPATAELATSEAAKRSFHSSDTREAECDEWSLKFDNPDRHS